MDVYADRVTLSPEQISQLQEMIEREGYRRIVIHAQNSEETLIVGLAGDRYLLCSDGRTEKQVAV